MVQVFQEVKRVLRDDGTLWLNMGDSYATSGHSGNERDVKGKHLVGGGLRSWGEHRKAVKPTVGISGLKPKDLCGIPWRLAFALQADGWYLRSDVIEEVELYCPCGCGFVLAERIWRYSQDRDIIWAKPNPMPESVSGCAWERHRIKVKSQPMEMVGYEGQKSCDVGKRSHPYGGVVNAERAEWDDCPGCSKCSLNDGYVLSWNAGRPTKSHEYLFLLTKSPKYFFDQEAVREKAEYGYREQPKNTWSRCKISGERVVGSTYGSNPEAGRNIRTVWNIATQPFKKAHFATFPEELALRCIKAGTSEKGVCPKCGGPWVRVVDKKFIPQTDVSLERGIKGAAGQKPMDESNGWNGVPRGSNETKTIGWKPSCQCGEKKTVPAIVLDPFGGACTVGVVAQRFNRRFVTLELKMDYCKMGKKRIYSQDVAML